MNIKAKIIFFTHTLSFVGLVMLAACDKKEPEEVGAAVAEKPEKFVGPVISPEDEVHAQYAGSASCKECHEAAYEDWKNSNHGLAERGVQMDTDRQAFVPKHTLEHSGRVTES